jgi:hypothetical protein
MLDLRRMATLHEQLSNNTGITPLLQATPAQSLSIVLTSAILLPLAWISVGLRFYTRHVLVEGCGWDDYSMAVTLVYSFFNPAADKSA